MQSDFTILPLVTKTCTKCGKVKPLSDFRPRKESRDSYSHHCWSCRLEYLRLYKARRRPQSEFIPVGFKKCPGCGEIKPLREYYNHRSSRDGKQSRCIPCHKEDGARSYANHADADRVKSSEYRARNPDAVRAYKAKWYEKHRDEVSAKRRARPDKVREYVASRRARKKGAFLERVEELAVFERDGWICGICGQHVEREDASLDHTIPLSKGGKHSYQNTQCSHLKCNLRKHARILDKGAQAC